MAPHHIYLVEDDVPLRASLTRLLEVSGYSVMGFASAEEMLTFRSANSTLTAPDCIVLDVNLPGMNGVAAQQQLRQANELCPVIFVSAELNAHHVNMAWRDGAAEFLFKPFQPKDLLNALQRIIEKQITTTPLPGAESIQGSTNTLAKKHAQLIESLTPRQLQVLLWLVEGHSNTQIAEKLHISARTVKMHREGLMQRLGIRHITELARIYENCKYLLKIPPDLI